MKTPVHLLLALSSVALGFAEARAVGAPEYTPMKVYETDQAVFPQEALDLGLVSGESSVAVSIDDHGRITDVLLVAYTHPAFGQQSEATVRHWRFQPASINGVPQGATMEFHFTYRSTGPVLVELTPSSYASYVFTRVMPDALAFHPCRLSQLDRIPVPSKIVSPQYSSAWTGSQPVHLKVSFYIDPDGRVRMPAVDRETFSEHPELATVAVNAVTQWQFERPLAGGHPVLVRAIQDFTFPARAASVEKTGTN